MSEGLRKVDSFKYWGSVTEENGRNEEISEKERQANTFLQSVRSLVWSREVPWECKKVIYETQCVPILTYASETWTVKGRDVSKIQATEMKFLRSRVGLTRMIRKRNEEVRVLVKEEPLQERI